MILVLTRLFFRLLVLFVAVFSVFLFYILWYKYNLNLGFVKTSWTYSFEAMSEENSRNYIILNWQLYKLDSDNKLVLSNILDQKSCGSIKIWNYANFVCFKNHDTNIVYISKNAIRLKKVKSSVVYKKLKLSNWNSVFEKYRFFWNGIKFYYYKNGDIVYEDWLSFKKLMNFPNIEFVWYDRKWFYIVKDNNLYYMKLKN